MARRHIHEHGALLQEPVAPRAQSQCCGRPLEHDHCSNLAMAVYRQSRIRPDALALSTQEGALTYGQLAQQAAGLAALLASSGEATESREPQRVGILASRSAQACIAVLGASWAGATYVPIGLKLPEERILTILSLCRLSALVVDQQGAKLLTERVLRAAPKSVYVLGADHQSPSPPGGIGVLDAASLETCEVAQPVATKPSDAAYIIFTSGTTGVPKGVVVALGGVLHYIQTMTPLLALAPADRVLETCELTFDVSVHNMFCTWEVGASLHVLPAARVMNAVSFAREHELTVWNSVPSLVGMLRQVKALSPGALPGLRLTVFGGEQLTRSTVDTWNKAAPGSAIINLYGPTEATVFCLAQRVADPLPLSPGRDVVSIGKPLPGSEAAVLDPAGNEVADGSPGELALAGMQLACGYLDAPELTAARFIGVRGKRWYLTGDLAIRDGSGNFHCLGRLDNQIKILGHRAELEEVDAHLRQVTDSGLVATVAWPWVDGAAQGLVAFVGGCSLDEASTLSALRVRLPHYMVPARVLPIEHMPVNASGKVDRKALRQLLESGMK